jgi:hypothetical protein
MIAASGYNLMLIISKRLPLSKPMIVSWRAWLMGGRAD